ncbi:MAG: alpha/beta hydrolase, partial [Spirochaetota bacterium]
MARHPAPLLAAARAISAIRERAATWNIDPERVAVLGFSAGAHLAASLGTMWGDASLLDLMGEAPGLLRPDALVLCYPVISGGVHRHEGSFLNLTDGDTALMEALSLEKRVSPETPPTFIWATSEDQTVPVENSILFAAALAVAKVPFELHVFERGGHGLS